MRINNLFILISILCLLSCFEGPTGSTGPTGPTGTTGPIGTTGQAGDPGVNGQSIEFKVLSGIIDYNDTENLFLYSGMLWWFIEPSFTLDNTLIQCFISYQTPEEFSIGPEWYSTEFVYTSFSGSNGIALDLSLLGETWNYYRVVVALK